MQIECDLEISGVWTEGGGYMGADATIDEHVAHLMKQAQYVKAVIVEGNGGTKTVLKNVRLKVKEIRMVEL